jgi:hypothetical protein
MVHEGNIVVSVKPVGDRNNSLTIGDSDHPNLNILGVLVGLIVLPQHYF